MIPTPSLQSSSNLLAHIAVPAARALLLGAAAGLALAAFRVKATSTRLFTWTAVLYAALAMPLLGWILPPMAVPTPTLLQNVLKSLAENNGDAPCLAVVARHGRACRFADGESVVGANLESLSTTAAARRQDATRPERSRTGVGHGSPALSPNLPPRGEGRPTPTVAPNSFATTNVSFDLPTPRPPYWSSLPWTLIVAAAYLAITAIFLGRFLIGLAYSRRLIRASQTIDDPFITRKLDSLVSARLAESDLISVPVTMGALRPTILLPADWRQWDAAKLNAVLAHEFSHVARRDPLTQRLSLLHRAIFWFNPLAWFLDRHLADLAEQASDEAALSCGTDRKHYARILLDFFEALHAAPGRVWWQGVSMAKAGQAEQRVERILSWKGSVAMRLKKSIAVAVVTLAIPVVYLVASAHPIQHVPSAGLQFQQDQTPAPAAQPTPAPKALAPATPEAAATPAPDAFAPPAPASPVDPFPAPAPAAGVRGGVAGRGPIGPRGPMTPPNPDMAPIASDAPVTAAAGYYQSDAKANQDKYQAEARALEARARASADMKSHGRGYNYAYAYRDDDDQRFVIVTGKSDSLTMSGSSMDARHVEKLRKSIPGDFIWFQADEKSYIIRDQATIDRARQLWAPQEELGKKQEELGKQQEALGKQQEELGAKMEKVRVNLPDVTAQLDKLKAELKALGQSATMEQIGKIQEEIGELQEKMGEIQSHAGDQQGKLGEEMGALGEKQGKLGEEQGKLGEQQAALAEKASKEMKLLLEDAVKKGLAQPEL